MRKANLTPFLIGAADLSLLTACTGKGVPAAGIIPELDVWTYTRKPKSAKLYEMKSDWGYMRHHKSDFLEMGLVKVAFLWELLSVGFDVLISDLDVVWLNGHWQRWMTWAHAAAPPVQEASLIALADVLVTTDELGGHAPHPAAPRQVPHAPRPLHPLHPLQTTRPMPRGDDRARGKTSTREWSTSGPASAHWRWCRRGARHRVTAST